MPDADTVVDLISGGLVWTILRKYVHSTATAGSQLAQVGVGHASSAVMGAAATVGQKLERCPVVARVLWLETAADLVRNVIRPQLAHGQTPEIVGERTEVLDVLFEYGVGQWHKQNEDRDMQRDAQRLERTGAFREQWTLLVCELSACWQADPAFRGWIAPLTT